jgi:type IV fimbrial biogenesis protein FimT
MNNMRRAMKGALGFTLVELMIALTVLGILAAAALPSMTTFVKGQRVKAAVSDVYASLIFARSEAIKRNQRVVLCASSDGTGCANSTNWAQGWIVFIDTDGDGFVGAVADILKKQGEIPAVSLTGTGTNATFLLDGRVSANVPDFVIRSADTPSITARCVRLDLSGRPNIKVDTNGNSADGCS